MPLREWIAQDRTRREIMTRFSRFLRRYRFPTDGPVIYPPKIRAMCSANSSSLEVSYVHLGDQAPILAIWLADVPRDMLEIFDEVLKQVVLDDFPHYNQVGGYSVWCIGYSVCDSGCVGIVYSVCDSVCDGVSMWHVGCELCVMCVNICAYVHGCRQVCICVVMCNY